MLDNLKLHNSVTRKPQEYIISNIAISRIDIGAFFGIKCKILSISSTVRMFGSFFATLGVSIDKTGL